VSEPYYSQRARCLRLSERFFFIELEVTEWSVKQIEHAYFTVASQSRGHASFYAKQNHAECVLN